jgi:hypothetical protein
MGARKRSIGRKGNRDGPCRPLTDRRGLTLTHCCDVNTAAIGQLVGDLSSVCPTNRGASAPFADGRHHRRHRRFVPTADGRAVNSLPCGAGDARCNRVDASVKNKYACDMESRWLRSLVLAYSALLVCPRCCCCLLASLPTYASQTAPVSAEPATCCVCGKNKAQSPDKSSSKKPTNTPSQNCPCSENQTLMPSVPPVEHVEVEFVAPIPSIKVMPPFLSFVETAGWDSPPGTSCLYVVNCVWRC